MISLIILSLFVGFFLGLLGGGGSVLTVPGLIYLLGYSTKQAVATSLLVVGVSSLVGIVVNARAGRIKWKKGFLFALWAMVGSYTGGKLAYFLSDIVQLVLFATVMLIAAFFMFKGRAQVRTNEPITGALFGAISFAVGILTGVVGVGGGFMIVPALSVLSRMDMQRAVGTSIFVIFLNCVAGFFSYMTYVSLNLSDIAIFVTGSSLSLFVGHALSQRIPAERLKKIFAVFLMVLAIFIINRSL